MTERQRTGKRTVTRTKLGASELSAEEERTIRMRHGWTLPSDVPLGRKSEGNRELEQRLLEMEQRAFEASGRLEELRARARAEEARESKRDKIVRALAEPDDE
ncbi:MAG: hypothetical protein HC923_06895 [Myxococcales bacterium]|nr:hypothetical protein [Myxococcales bacterium]